MNLIRRRKKNLPRSRTRFSFFIFKLLQQEFQYNNLHINMHRSIDVVRRFTYVCEKKKWRNNHHNEERRKCKSVDKRSDECQALNNIKSRQERASERDKPLHIQKFIEYETFLQLKVCIFFIIIIFFKRAAPLIFIATWIHSFWLLDRRRSLFFNSLKVFLLNAKKIVRNTAKSNWNKNYLVRGSKRVKQNLLKFCNKRMRYNNSQRKGRNYTINFDHFV